MVQKFSFFFLFIFFNHITFSHQKLFFEDNEAIKIEIGSPVHYDISRNYFKFDYKGSNEETIYFCFRLNFDIRINFTDPNGYTYELYDEYQSRSKYRVYQARLEYNGTYFLKI